MSTPTQIMKTLDQMISLAIADPSHLPTARSVAYIASKQIYLMRVTGVIRTPALRAVAASKSSGKARTSVKSRRKGPPPSPATP